MSVAKTIVLVRDSAGGYVGFQEWVSQERAQPVGLAGYGETNTDRKRSTGCSTVEVSNMIKAGQIWGPVESGWW